MGKNSIFIVIEGLDGSGKTSVSRQLANVLDYSFKGKVKLTFEPHDPSCGGLFIRQVLMKKIRNFTPRLLALAFATNRLDHCDREITPWLEDDEHRIVICDRYYLSSLVYQRTDDFSFDAVMGLNDMARKPDVIFFINVSDKVCYERMKIRNQPRELFEENLSGTRKKYLEAISYLRNRGTNIIEIDGSGTIDEVVHEVIEKLQEHFPMLEKVQPLLSSPLVPHLFTADDPIEYSTKTLIDELVQTPFFPNNEADYTQFDNTEIKTMVENKFDKLTFDQLAAIFLDFIKSIGYQCGQKLPWTDIDCYELAFELPAGIKQRGTALLINQNQRYDIILQKSYELFEMSDFMIVLSPGPSELVTNYYERDKMRYQTDKKEHEVSLFPSTKLITQRDLTEYVFSELVRLGQVPKTSTVSAL